MQTALLYTADLLRAVAEMMPADAALQQIVREAEASADVKFPDGALLIVGAHNMERSWPLHQAMAKRALEEAEANDYRRSHLEAIPLFLCERFGHTRIPMHFWNIQWAGREPADSLVSFRYATDVSRLKLIVTFLKRAKPDVMALVVDRTRRLLESLAEHGIAGERGTPLLSPIEPIRPKAITFTIDASSTGFHTMIWLGYQLYLLRDVWPVEDVMDDRTAQGIVIEDGSAPAPPYVTSGGRNRPRS
jgi:hypothetical protein